MELGPEGTTEIDGFATYFFLLRKGKIGPARAFMSYIVQDAFLFYLIKLNKNNPCC